MRNHIHQQFLHRSRLLACVVMLYAAVAAKAGIVAAQPATAKGTTKVTLTVLAASSLTDAFKEIKTAFEAANPTVEVIYSFGSSATLAAQIKEGATADVFASANLKQMQAVQDAGSVLGPSEIFAQNRLVLIVPKENPAKINSLKDLAQAGIKVILAAPKVPVRDYTDTMLMKLATAAGYGAAYREAVLRNVVSEEENVRQVAAKIALGEADAGIVYLSDVTPDLSKNVTAIPIPDEFNTIASYPIAVLVSTSHLDLAKRYLAFVLSKPGQAILERWNFIPLSQFMLTPTPTRSATPSPTP